MDLRPLFKPKTIAVVGVSLHNDLHPANIIYYKNLLRYPVEVFPVNPKAGILKGQRAFTSVMDIPQKIDLAIIVARAEYVPSILEDCIKAQVRGAVIISGGFAEVGNFELNNRIVDIAREADFPFVGPNCLGIYSPQNFDGFFIPTERTSLPDIGNVALLSQSGGLLADQLIRFSGESVGLSLGVSIGNKAVIGESELIEYLQNDPQTKVISFYIEGFGQDEGREFLMTAGKCPKPIVMLKAGKSPGGSRAVSSHTAALAGDYKVFSSVLAQHGVVEAKTPSELIYFSKALSNYQISIQGRVAIVSISGGHGAMVTDLCSEYGLQVPVLSEYEQEQIRNMLSPTVKPIATCSNPIDLSGSANDDDFVEVAKLLSTNDEIDCIMLLCLPYAPGLSADIGGMLGRVYQRYRKPMIGYVPRLEKYRMIIEGFEINGVPVSHSIEGVVHMGQALMKYRGNS